MGHHICIGMPSRASRRSHLQQNLSESQHAFRHVAFCPRTSMLNLSRTPTDITAADSSVVADRVSVRRPSQLQHKQLHKRAIWCHGLTHPDLVCQVSSFDEHV